MRTLLIALNFSKYGISRLLCPPKILSNVSESGVSLSGKYVPIISMRSLCSINDDKTHGHGQHQKNNDAVGGSVLKSGKYELFKDENAPVILDVIEERRRIQDTEEIEEDYDEFAGIDLERGVTGVFDIEQLVDVLRRENAIDIFVAKLPEHLQYVDYIVVVTGRSLKHMLGLVEFVRRVFKVKRHKNDTIPRLEGETSKDWLAIDLGNIALHIMSKSARSEYDLESLWALGKEYDEKSNAAIDPLAEILKKHAINLDDFQPADSFR